MERARRPKKQICRLMSLWSFVSFLCGLLVVSITPVTGVFAQTAERLSDVRKLYLDSLGHDRGAAEVRSRLVRRLNRGSTIKVVENVHEADAVAKGTGRIWTIGRVSLNPHLRGVTQTTFEGFLSLEVIGKNNQTLWSYLVTPGKFPWNGIPDDLAKQLVKQLFADIGDGDRTQAQSVTNSPTTGRVALKGAGATFPAPLYLKWFESFEQSQPNVQIGYDAVGSGEGIRRLKEKQVDFAASEMPLSDEEEMSAVHPRFEQVPIVLGAVVPIYHVDNVRQGPSRNGMTRRLS